MRTIPNDKHQTAAMASLISIYGWNWVGIITTDGNYGQSALDHFVSQASEKGICVAFKSILPQSVTSHDVSSAIKETAATIYKNPKARVIVSFAKPTHMKHLYQELKNQILKTGEKLKAMKRVWVASDIWSTSSSVIGTLTLEDIGHVVGLTFRSGDMSSFREYLSRLEAPGQNNTGNNSFMQELYTQLNTSDVSGDTELMSKAVQTLKEESQADTILNVEMAVSAVAQAVAATCRNRDCKTSGSGQPWEVFTYMHVFVCLCVLVNLRGLGLQAARIPVKLDSSSKSGFGWVFENYQRKCLGMLTMNTDFETTGSRVVTEAFLIRLPNLTAYFCLLKTFGVCSLL